MTYPDCSSCGHNASGVVAGRCTAFVRLPEGDPSGKVATYCYCRCIEDPAVMAWMRARPAERPYLLASRTDDGGEVMPSAC